ncbi:hypothetical protein SHJG_6802 [Streptomyces hygroscopicus subsp. jinggangensis 5008]|nr:hypothetical protein SHJG_6802 [Streptomyces hygroscopicus subsp. jinggangensis 5008]AGF66225.1 hypothetical protein SHJGH_6562 [Streptomyces hygroscopicus subsp. jinggangensis TL01]
MLKGLRPRGTGAGVDRGVRSAGGAVRVLRRLRESVTALLRLRVGIPRLREAVTTGLRRGVDRARLRESVTARRGGAVGVWLGRRGLRESVAPGLGRWGGGAGRRGAGLREAVAARRGGAVGGRLRAGRRSAGRARLARLTRLVGGGGLAGLVRLVPRGGRGLRRLRLERRLLAGHAGGTLTAGRLRLPAGHRTGLRRGGGRLLPGLCGPLGGGSRGGGLVRGRQRGQPVLRRGRRPAGLGALRGRGSGRYGAVGGAGSGLSRVGLGAGVGGVRLGEAVSAGLAGGGVGRVGLRGAGFRGAGVGGVGVLGRAVRRTAVRSTVTRQCAVVRRTRLRRTGLGGHARGPDVRGLRRIGLRRVGGAVRPGGTHGAVRAPVSAVLLGVTLVSRGLLGNAPIRLVGLIGLVRRGLLIGGGRVGRGTPRNGGLRHRAVLRGSLATGLLGAVLAAGRPGTVDVALAVDGPLGPGGTQRTLRTTGPLGIGRALGTTGAPIPGLGRLSGGASALGDLRHLPLQGDGGEPHGRSALQIPVVRLRLDRTRSGRRLRPGRLGLLRLEALGQPRHRNGVTGRRRGLRRPGRGSVRGPLRRSERRALRRTVRSPLRRTVRRPLGRDERSSLRGRTHRRGGRRRRCRARYRRGIGERQPGSRLSARVTGSRGPGGPGETAGTSRAAGATGTRTARSGRVLRVPGGGSVVDGELAGGLDGLRVGLVIAGCVPAPAHPVPIAAHSSSWCGRAPSCRAGAAMSCRTESSVVVRGGPKHRLSPRDTDAGSRVLPSRPLPA